MHDESPGVSEFRRSVLIVRSRPTALGMGEAMRRLASLTHKLVLGERLRSPEDDGYIPQGVRRNVIEADSAAARACLMLGTRLAGRPHETEISLAVRDVVEPPPAVAEEGPVKIALVTEAAVVPKGNPDRIPSGWAMRWHCYDLSGLDDLTGGEFETVHGGFDTTAANEDPDRLVPLDALRDLEREGRVEIWNELFSTCGNMGSLRDMERMGQEIGDRLRRAEIRAALVGST
jgi:glycine reductase